MQAYTVKLSNSYTGKNKTKIVKAEGWQAAYVGAVSNYMMANAWFVDTITDAAGAIVWQPGAKLLSA